MKTLKLRRLVVALSVHNEGAKVRKFRDSLIRDRIVGGVLSGTVTHQTLMVPNVHSTLVENSRLKKRQLLVPVSVEVTGTHLFSHLAALPLQQV